MRKIYFISILLLTSVLLTNTSCRKEDNLPKPDFIANHYSSTNKEITIAFTDMSSNDAEEWIWTFEGGIPAISYDRDPIITYNSAGTFNVTLTVRNTHGTREITKFDHINIGDFFNPTWADIHIIHNSQNKVVAVDDTILLAEIETPIINYYAETYGQTNEGNQIGLLIYWNESLNLNNGLYWDFIIDDIFVFINVQNEGPDNFYPFTVNFGEPEYEITDNITIPNDGLWKSTGYYDAWDYMKIRAFFESNPDIHVEWEENYHFDLLWVVNQGLDLWYDGSKSTLKSEVKTKNLREIAKPIIQSGSERKK